MQAWGKQITHGSMEYSRGIGQAKRQNFPLKVSDGGVEGSLWSIRLKDLELVEPCNEVKGGKV
jgi:hypothetical protein